MGQEFFINSQDLEDKIRKLLPSQGGAGAGFDLSASTQIIPIIDLTESAEGSNLREDLQTSLSFDSSTAFSVTGATSTIINNTGYFRIFGNAILRIASTGNTSISFNITDGSSTKKLIEYKGFNSSTQFLNFQFDFKTFLGAGDSINVISDADCTAIGVTRQIADITGQLVDP